ncbi:ABC1 kinase family protein [Anthocerotibacter panamensis]|uniref:ABC1 kinase family protein n=1 Tax=Anthocerotibacter panamensis TaxID=2857077 RepID=UPI001C403F92|nr:AarF/ABC1/UbiB kinase family protein [Anthocerotibacter panamensis]
MNNTLSGLNQPLLTGSDVRPAAPAEGLRHYKPDAIEEYYRARWWDQIRRLFQIFGPILFFFLGLGLDRLTGQLARNEQKRAFQLLRIFTRLGPFYIKIGQALSTRPDLVPPVYLEILTQLQDNVPPFSNTQAYALITQELGRPPAEVYQTLSAEPIASASLGQVYRGTLMTGEDVAVKVQRPELLPVVTLDLYLLRTLLAWAKGTFPKIFKSDVVAILDEFGTKLFEEMDYIQEGQNAERFARLLKAIPEVYVPTIHWAYTRHRVLTMEWIDGIKLTKVEEVKAQGLDANKIIEVGVQASLRQLMEYGFFHADPHPGNLMAMRDGRLAYLDFGMMSEVTPEQRYGLLEAVVHLVNRDFPALSRDYVNLGFLETGADLSLITPALEMVFGSALGSSVSDLNFKSITDKLSGVMYELPFRVPAYYALIIRSLVTLEGIAISINPDFKVLELAYPYVANRFLTDDSPRLRQSLYEMLFKDNRFRWNRLENLLKNARGAREYTWERTLDQVLDFLFSDRGQVIRERMLEELFTPDDKGITGYERLTSLLERSERSSLAQTVQRVLPVFSRVLARREGRQLTQQLMSRWLEQQAARLLRQLLTGPDPEPVALRKASVKA